MARVTVKQLKSQVTRLRNDLNAVKNNSALVRRQGMAKALGKSFEGDRDTYKVLGYPTSVGYDELKNMYDREGLATRIVNAVSDETWREHPLLIEGENKTADELDAPSDLQIQFEQLADRLDLYSAFNDADAYCGISRFALIVLGLPGKWEDPAKYGQQLAYVSVHDEGSATIADSDLETNVESPRFGLPNFYSVKIDEKKGMMKRIHWSRVLHIKEGRSKSRTYGVARLQSMYNRLLDLEKVVGGGSEAFWLQIHRGLALSAKDGMTLPAPDTDAYKDMQDEIQEYEHGIRRIMRLAGMDVTDLGGRPVDSAGQFNVVISYLAGSSRIPQRILIGSEAGHLASSQDEYNFANFIVSRQQSFAEPKILRAFIKMCGDLGILSVPKKYTVSWPSLFQLTEQEQANIASTVAGAIATITGGAPETMLEPEEFAQRWLDYSKPAVDMVEVLAPSEVAGKFAPKVPDPREVLKPAEQVAKLPNYSALRPTWFDWEKIKNALRPKRKEPVGVLSKPTLVSNGIWLNENENSVMVAFRIPDNLREELQAQYPFMDDETRDNLHITLCYLGDNRTLDVIKIGDAVQSWARASTPIKVQLQGLARFVSEGDKDPVVMTVDSPELPEFRMNLTTMFDVRGIRYHEEHGFIPHMTLAYIDKDANLPIETIEPLELNFDTVYFVNGEAWTEFRLGEDVVQVQSKKGKRKSK